MGIAYQVSLLTPQRTNNTSSFELLIDQIKIDENKTTSINYIKNKELNIFPNPTNGEIIIQNLPKNAQVTILNTFGELMKVSNQKKIDLSELTNGIYFLHIIHNNQIIKSQKIIKN